MKFKLLFLTILLSLHCYCQGNNKPCSNSCLDCSGILVCIDCICKSPGHVPIELVEFKGKSYGNYTILEWCTESETNNDYFIIEKSDNSVDFRSIIFYDSKALGGNSDYRIEYSALDIEIRSGVSYYRLKQVDYNNNSSVSMIIFVDNPHLPEILIKIINLEGQKVTEEYKGIKFYIYTDKIVKIY